MRRHTTSALFTKIVVVHSVAGVDSTNQLVSLFGHFVILLFSSFPLARPLIGNRLLLWSRKSTDGEPLLIEGCKCTCTNGLRFQKRGKLDVHVAHKKVDRTLGQVLQGW